MLSNNIIQNLTKKSAELRLKTFELFVQKGEAHLGGSFSMIEVLIYLYERVLNKKDKFILSKSHASFPLCILLRERGYKTKITTHLEHDPKNGIFCTTGSLGHGLPISVGMAFAKKKLKQPGKIYVLLSDGECQEGTTWESLLIATKHKLHNLVVLIDYNKIQALSRIEDALPLSNLKKKFEAFNCRALEIKNGHSFNEINKAFKKKYKSPTVIIFHTIKGKGVKEFENKTVWHARKLEKNDIAIGKKRLGYL